MYKLLDFCLLCGMESDKVLRCMLEKLYRLDSEKKLW
jgi:hypothetical protein